jgi:hypothetical protein
MVDPIVPQIVKIFEDRWTLSMILVRLSGTSNIPVLQPVKFSVSFVFFFVCYPEKIVKLKLDAQGRYGHTCPQEESQNLAISIYKETSCLGIWSGVGYGRTE